MDLSVSIIDDNQELDRILESMNLARVKTYQLAYGCSSHKHTSVRMAFTLDTKSTYKLEPCEGSSTVLHSEVDPCRRSSLSSPH